MKKATRKTPPSEKVRDAKPDAGATIRQVKKQVGNDGDPKRRG